MTTRLLIVEVPDAPDDPRSCEGCPFASISYQDGSPLCTHPTLEAPRGPGGERSEECLGADISRPQYELTTHESTHD